MNHSFLNVKLKKQLHSFDLNQEFSLKEHQSLALLGASGSGKSMTLRLLSGLVLPNEGQIILKERVLYDSLRRINIPSRERKIGLVFQNYALFPHLTVAQNIAYGIPKTIAKTQRQETVEELLTEIRLETLSQRYPSQLSGGQQQRVALARTLAARPQLLLLDEPFSALDTALKSELEELLLRFREAHQIPYILVTHNLEEAYRLCDEIAIMENGKILQKGPKDEVLRSPQSPEAARKIGARNLWLGEVIQRQDNGGKVFVPSLSLELNVHTLPASQTVWVGIRPTEAILWTDKAPVLPNTFPVSLLREVHGVQSHTLFVSPTAIGLIEVEVPSYRLKTGPYFLSLPPEKLFTMKA